MMLIGIQTPVSYTTKDISSAMTMAKTTSIAVKTETRFGKTKKGIQVGALNSSMSGLLSHQPRFRAGTEQIVSR